MSQAEPRLSLYLLSALWVLYTPIMWPFYPVQARVCCFGDGVAPGCVMALVSGDPSLGSLPTHRALPGSLSGRSSAGAGCKSQPAAPELTRARSTGTCDSGGSRSQISTWSVGEKHVTRTSDEGACVPEPLSDLGRDHSFSLRAQGSSPGKEAESLT